MPATARPVAFLVILACLLVGAGPAQAITAREKGYQDWLLRCERQDDKSPERCFIVQTAKDAKSGLDALRIGVRYIESGKPTAFLRVPVGIYLPEGLQLQIDDGDKLRIDLEFCTPTGCHTRIDLNESLMKKMKDGRQAVIVFRLIDFRANAQRDIKVPVSLAGFTAAVGALK